MLHESPETPLGACVAIVDPIETTEEAIDKSAKPPRLSALTPSPLATFEQIREGREQLKKVAKGGREPEHSTLNSK